jgi:hypothetical protein
MLTYSNFLEHGTSLGKIWKGQHLDMEGRCEYCDTYTHCQATTQ